MIAGKTDGQRDNSKIQGFLPKWLKKQHRRWTDRNCGNEKMMTVEQQGIQEMSQG